MPEKSQFFIELKASSTTYNMKFLRMLYTPIIGAKAILLYQLYFDYFNLNQGYTSFYDSREIESILNINHEQLLLERKRLEAVGLIRAYEKSDGKAFIVTLNPPLAATQFRQNSLLYKEAINKLGDILFERIEFSTKSKKVNKEEFYEVTTKYQDLFDLSILKEKKQENTMETALPTFESKEEAIAGLTYAQFIFFLTNQRLSPSQLAIFQQSARLGFSSKSLNLIIDYSFTVNSKIVANHIHKIAKDLFTKEIKDATQIEFELKNALKSKQTISSSTAKKEVKTEVAGDDEQEWKDIFSSLGGI